MLHNADENDKMNIGDDYGETNTPFSNETAPIIAHVKTNLKAIKLWASQYALFADVIIHAELAIQINADALKGYDKLYDELRN